MQLFAKQPGVAPHRFESCTFRQFYATLAQWIVQRNSSPFDAGSSPVCRSSFFNHHGASNANILGFLCCVFGSLQRMASRIMRKLFLKAYIAMLIYSIGVWEKEYKRGNPNERLVIRFEQDCRMNKLKQLESKL